jgi:uncharacterized protein (TIGR00251 family)
MISLNINVKPGSFKNEINFDASGDLVVKLREKPIDGAANEALVNYLAEEFNISKSRVRLEKGQTSRFKKISIDLSEEELASRLKKFKG